MIRIDLYYLIEMFYFPEEGSGDKPLRLVLKVGGATPESGEFSSEHHEKKHHKHKKKKKKKSSDKDKERHKHHHSDSSEKHEKREVRNAFL